MGVGRRLREARDSKGLTLMAVAERTKIPPRQLSLLENEEYDRLPAGIFVRGYVRAVAVALGLNADRMAEEFRQELQPPPPRRHASADMFETRPESLRLRLAPEHVSKPDVRSPGRTLALVLLAVSVILVILWLRREGPAVPDTGAERPGAVVETLVRTGNAAALHLTINGVRARRIGSSGEARTIQITPGNYRAVLGEGPH